MAPSPPEHQVLYIEDHEDTVEMVSLMLQARGFQITARRTAEDALKAAAEQSFDLYLIDSWLPDGWGVDLCKKIREFDSHTPIVFYTAAAFEGDRDVALKAGAQAYLIKPTDSLDLADSLSRLIHQNGDGFDGGPDENR